MDFGYVPLAGGFFSPTATDIDFASEPKYPLVVCFCTSCGLVQINNVISGAQLFENYFYFSSAIKTLVEHFEEYATTLASIAGKPSSKFVVEIGCNDGVFLSPLTKQGFKVLGVDPAVNVVNPLIKKGMPIMRAYFGEDTARKIVATKGRADIILGSNSLAHIDDMHDVARGLSVLLKPKGFISMETHYLGTLIKQWQYDFFYHEHHSYYSLTSLSKFFAMYGMEIYDAYLVKMHAGSMRYFIQKKGGGRPISARIKQLKREEIQQGLTKLSTFKAFSARLDTSRLKLMKKIKLLQSHGKSIVGYGASGRATTIMSYCGITRDHLNYLIDDAPAKKGAFTPGNHILIKDSSILSDPKNRPDYCLLLAWSFAGEIIKRNQKYLELGGKFIVPLPKVYIYPK